MNSHTGLQQDGLKALMNYNDNNNIDMSANLQNGDFSIVIGLLKRQTLPKNRESSNLNAMNVSPQNFDVNCGYWYMNSPNLFESNNHNSIDYTNKRDETDRNRYVMENNRLPDGICIDVMLPSSKHNKYSNMEYNNVF